MWAVKPTPLRTRYSNDISDKSFPERSQVPCMLDTYRDVKSFSQRPPIMRVDTYSDDKSFNERSQVRMLLDKYSDDKTKSFDERSQVRKLDKHSDDKADDGYTDNKSLHEGKRKGHIQSLLQEADLLAKKRREASLEEYQMGDTIKELLGPI